MRGATLSFTVQSSRNTFQSTLPMRGATFVHRTFARLRTYFNPRSPCGERPDCERSYCRPSDFNPRSPCGERHEVLKHYGAGTNFNPRSPCGERRKDSNLGDLVLKFQSTLPMRGATQLIFHLLDYYRISIHAPHAGSDFVETSLGYSPWISIHAPHAGSDWLPINKHTGGLYFNPRSPCGERLSDYWVQGAMSRFQSTLPMRGATGVATMLAVIEFISIHAPHAGSDRIKKQKRHAGGDFNPRSPCGERRNAPVHARFFRHISIHAPHAGSDFGMPTTVPTTTDFNPRSPCGERRYSVGSLLSC